MKIGIKEFRERISEVTHGHDLIEITHHGKTLGLYQPLRRDPEKVREAAASIARSQAEMAAKGVDLEAELAAIGLDSWGEPLNANNHC
jgi:hypothetical protein